MTGSAGLKIAIKNYFLSSLRLCKKYIKMATTGYASLNGCVATLSLDNGKFLDIEPMSRHCRMCKSREDLKKSDPNKYDEWFEVHKSKCKLNYAGYAGGMEVTGTERIFGRSVEKHGLRYTKFLGDGDSKSHHAVANIYPGVTVEKLECVGHVQKRVGTRLRNLKKNVKNLGGAGKLTDKMIDRLQNYYGIAVRSNKGNLEAMKKAIYAVIFHVASSKENLWHDHCPSGESSWCAYQGDKATKQTTYTPGNGLPHSVIKHVREIFIK